MPSGPLPAQWRILDWNKNKNQYLAPNQLIRVKDREQAHERQNARVEMNISLMV